MTKYSRHLEFLFLLVISLAVWWRPLTSEFQLALSSDAHTYVLLIIPLSVALIYFGKRDALAARDGGQIWGTILLGIALAVRLLAARNAWHLTSSDSLSVNISALVLSWIGSVIFCFGLGALKNNLFPLCFLFLCIPLPDQALVWVTQSLQETSAWATAGLFHLAGVPVTRDGIMLSIPGLDIEVARECSSIRSSTMLMVVTLILAQLFLQTWPRKTALVLAAIPLSFLKNAIRIFTIAELGTRVNPDFLDGKLHHEGGIIFFGVAVLAMVILLWALRKSERELIPQTAPEVVTSLQR